jgi:citrate synthase
MPLAKELIGKVSFTEHFFLLLVGRMPSAGEAAVLNAALVAIAEHGLVPSVQAARMTLAAAPDAMQGAVAAGILGCGSVVLGSSETAGRMYSEIDRESLGRRRRGGSARVMQRWRAAGKAIPATATRCTRSATSASTRSSPSRAAPAPTCASSPSPRPPKHAAAVLKQDLKLNVSGAIPAVLLGAGFPVEALKGVPILARTAGLIAHLYEEIGQPIGFALSYQATREMSTTATLPAGFGAPK